MNCQEALNLLGEHVDGQLGVGDRWRLQLHLWICRLCRRYLSSYRVTVQAAKSARGEEEDIANQQIPDALIASILDGKNHQ